jgi:protein required for attachment to host cells
MKKVWIVVAESARARILSQEKSRAPLIEQEDLVHPASKQQPHDLTSDRTGRAISSAQHGPRHAMQQQTDPQRNEMEKFARQVADRLDRARRDGAFDELVLVAPPRFLGALTAHLGDATLAAVTKRIANNLVRHSLADIAKHVNNGGTAD